MAAIRELDAALRATDDWIDDLTRCRCDASLGTMQTFQDAMPMTKEKMIAA